MPRRHRFHSIRSDHLAFAFHVASTRCSAYAARSNLHVRWLLSPIRPVNTTDPLFANVKLSIRITAPYNLRVSRCLRVVAKVTRPLSNYRSNSLLAFARVSQLARGWFHA